MLKIFSKLTLEKGKLLSLIFFKEARKPAFKLWIDFGDEIGIKKSSAQITDLYKPEDLIGKSVLAIVNLQPRQIGPFISEVLVLGLKNNENSIVLISPEFDVPNGSKLI